MIASDDPRSGDRLDGFRIGVTSDRRSEDLIAAFERRGAEVVHAPTIRMVGVGDLGHLEAETAAIIRARPDILLATTSYGVHCWFEAADAAGLGAELLDVLRTARVFVRGPKARGAIRGAGLDDEGMGEHETTESLVDLVLQGDVEGKTVAVQLHGVTDLVQLERLKAAGASVLSARPYTWLKHEDRGRVARLVTAITVGGVDAVTFTSAPAADALIHASGELGRLPEVLAAFRGEAAFGPVVAAAVGPVTAEPLREHGIEPIVPDRFRMGALIRLVSDHLVAHHEERLPTQSGLLSLRGRMVDVDGDSALLGPTSAALLRQLVLAKGATVHRSVLASAALEPLDAHGVDVAISRLRRSLPRADVIQTIVKRGYRIRTP